MAIDLADMRKRLEEKQAEIQQHIATLTGSPAPEDAIQASDGVEEPEEEAVDLQETDVEQAILDSEKTLLAEVQQALVRIDNGTYGICSNCGQPIRPAPIAAICRSPPLSVLHRWWCRSARRGNSSNTCWMVLCRRLQARFE